MSHGLLAAGLCILLGCRCSPSTNTIASSGAASSDGNDAVAIRGSIDPAVLAVDGQGMNTCLGDELFEGSGTIDLKDRIEGTSGCPTEVVAFTGDRAVELDGTPVWSHDPAKPVELTLKPPVGVELRFYVPSGAPQVEQDAQDEMDLATALFAKNRAGLVFTSPSTMAYSPAQKAVIGDGCDVAASLVIAGAGTGLYDPDRINVYYVNRINSSDSYLGYNCYQKPIAVGGMSALGENVIYISIDNRAPTTLTHELGHALGLRDKAGHTNGVAGFTKRNLMLSGISLADQAAQDHLSLGQGYRMSLDRLSWLNHSRPSGAAPVRAGDSRSCQTAVMPALGDPCPALVLDP